MMEKAAFRYLLFSLAAIAITAASFLIVKDYDQFPIWAVVLAASAASAVAVMFLSINNKISEFETIKYLIAGQWLTLFLFCLMAILVDQSVYDMQHRIEYNNCSMALMLMGVAMTGTNSVSLIMYMKTTKDHLNDSEVLMEKFDDNIKDLVNSICLANNLPPKYEQSKKGMFSFMKKGQGTSEGEPSSKPRFTPPKFTKESTGGDGSSDDPSAAGDSVSKPRSPLIRLKKKGDGSDTGGDDE